jgi:hypothetical protein
MLKNAMKIYYIMHPNSLFHNYFYSFRFFFLFFFTLG